MSEQKKKQKKAVKIPRRVSMRLTKAQAKKMALEAVSNVLEGHLGSTLVEGFTVRMLREEKRPPTEGEKNLFLEQVAQIVEGLRKKAK